MGTGARRGPGRGGVSTQDGWRRSVGGRNGEGRRERSEVGSRGARGETHGEPARWLGAGREQAGEAGQSRRWPGRKSASGGKKGGRGAGEQRGWRARTRGGGRWEGDQEGQTGMQGGRVRRRGGCYRTRRGEERRDEDGLGEKNGRAPRRRVSPSEPESERARRHAGAAGRWGRGKGDVGRPAVIGARRRQARGDVSRRGGLKGSGKERSGGRQRSGP